MKKSVMVGLTVIFFLSASLSLAGDYTVKKGDSLSVIGQRFGVPWRKVAKDHCIIAPYIIRIGQVLKISAPVQTIVARETKATADNSAYLAKINFLQKRILELEIKIKQAQIAAATTDQEPIGQERAAQVVTSRVADVQAGSQESKQDIAAPAVGSQKTVAELQKKEVVAPGAVEKVTADKDLISAKKAVVAGKSDQFDAIMNLGHYAAVNGASNSGNYLSGRLRYRPFTFFDSKLALGVFAYGNMVNGEYGKNSDSYYKRVWTVGPTAKYYGKGWDANLDLGFGRVNEYGKGYDQTQTVFSPFIWYSNYARRSESKAWFSKTELGLSMVMPFNDGKRDMRTGELYFTQWFYDWKFSRDVRLSAGLETSLGYSGGFDNKFYRLGPALSLDYKNQSVITLGVGYKDKLNSDGDLWLVNGSVNIGNVIELIKASKITEPKPQDLVNKK
ncbi:MAG: LysM peptidoglycan-binding domain-containing protein [Candidatus Falkowbacteria bacterium]